MSPKAILRIYEKACATALVYTDISQNVQSVVGKRFHIIVEK